MLAARAAHGCSARWMSSPPKWDTYSTNHRSLPPAPSLPSNPLPLLIHWKKMQRVIIIRQVQIAGRCYGWRLPLNNGPLPYQREGWALVWRCSQALRRWHIICYPAARAGLSEAPGAARVLTPHQFKSGGSGVSGEGAPGKTPRSRQIRRWLSFALGGRTGWSEELWAFRSTRVRATSTLLYGCIQTG